MAEVDPLNEHAPRATIASYGGVEVNLSSSELPVAASNAGIHERDHGEADREVQIEKEEGSSRVGTKMSYPYIALGFIFISTVTQSATSGIQAILELYFVEFLFVCSTKSTAETLSTICVNTFIASWLLASLPAGLLADYCLGNYITQVLSMIAATVSIWLVLFSSWQYSVTKPICCVNQTNSSMALSYLAPSSGEILHSVMGATGDHGNCSELTVNVVFPEASLGLSPSLLVALALIGLVLFALSFGQTNAIASVFVGDQFSEEQSKGKERSFSWFYLCMNVGQLIAEGGFPVARQSVGFIVTFTIATGLYTLNIITFLSGTCFYVRKKPQRPALPSSCCKRQVTEEKGQLLTHDKNKSTSTRGDTWRQLLRIVGVFAPLIIYWGIFFQQNSTWVLQGRRMNCYLGSLHVPPDIMPSVNDVTVILLIPILEYIVYPHIQSTMGFTVRPLHKLVAGMVAAALSFLFALLLQIYISEPALPCQGEVSIAWQLPQILLISVAEVTVSVTGLEFAYSQAPPQLRNIIVAMWYITQALGTLLNALIALVQLNLMYEFLIYTVLMVAVVILFIAINWKFKYRDTD